LILAARSAATINHSNRFPPRIGFVGRVHKFAAEVGFWAPLDGVQGPPEDDPAIRSPPIPLMPGGSPAMELTNYKGMIGNERADGAKNGGPVGP
jgi:hypothetical protein